MRAQVNAALRLLSGAVEAQIRMSNLFDRPGASVLRSIFEEAYQEQELDMLSAQQMLEVLASRQSQGGLFTLLPLRINFWILHSKSLQIGH